MANTVEQYADDIMAMIDEVIDDEACHNSRGLRMPWDVASFGELHEYCDANEFLIEAAVPFGADVPGDDPGAMVNAVTDEVSRRLAERAKNRPSEDNCLCGGFPSTVHYRHAGSADTVAYSCSEECETRVEALRDSEGNLTVKAVRAARVAQR